jgi:hypothetical protein
MSRSYEILTLCAYLPVDLTKSSIAALFILACVFVYMNTHFINTLYKEDHGTGTPLREHWLYDKLIIIIPWIEHSEALQS